MPEIKILTEVKREKRGKCLGILALEGKTYTKR